MPRLRKPSGPAAVLRRFVYGDAPAEEWLAHAAGVRSEPWASFERAQQLVHVGRVGDAATIWRQIAATEGLESRHVLQAWHFLRQAGFAPPARRCQARAWSGRRDAGERGTRPACR